MFFPGKIRGYSVSPSCILLLALAAYLQAGLSEKLTMTDGHSSHVGGMFWVCHLGFESLGSKRGEFWSASGGTSFTVGEEWRGSSGQSRVCALVSLSSHEVCFVGIRGGCVREEVAQESTASSSISGLRPVSVLSPPLTSEQREVENHWAVNSLLPFDIFLR